MAQNIHTTTVGNIAIYQNSDVKARNVHIFRSRDRNYTPLVQYPTNKTIVCGQKVFQLIVHMNKIDVFVPNDSLEFFRDSVLSDLISYLTGMIGIQTTSSLVANEIDYSLNIYVDENDPAARRDWWKMKNPFGFDFDFVERYRWQDFAKTQVTSLGVKLPFMCTRFTMPFRFDESFNLL